MCWGGGGCLFVYLFEREIGGGHARLCLIVNMGVQAGVEFQIFFSAQKGHETTPPSRGRKRVSQLLNAVYYEFIMKYLQRDTHVKLQEDWCFFVEAPVRVLN